MPAEHLLARMTAKGLQITGVGFGGIASIAAQDVAASLAGLPDHIYWLARAKFCDDTACSDLVWKYTTDKIVRREKIEEGKAKGLALSALFPVIWGVKCKACHGTGINYRYKPCKRCGETGLGVVPDYQKASMMQVSRATFCRKYSRLSIKYESDAWSWESAAIRHVYRQFSDIDEG
jgi:hypothetical protein